MVAEINPVYITQAFDFFMRYLTIAFQVMVTLGVGYALGLVASGFIDALLSIKEIEKQLILYGAMTSRMWSSVRSFIKYYLRWFVLALVLTTTGMSITFLLYSFMANLFWFILLSVIGLIIGGIAAKAVRDGLDAVGLDEQLKKHKVDNAVGGVSVPTLMSEIVRWYIVLLFVGEGVLRLNLSFIGGFIHDIVLYVPSAVSGVVLLVVSLVIARYASESVKSRKIAFSELIALGIEATIIFFGLVISLPVFKEDVDVSILTDSFKILVAGVSLGMAIALGLGLKDSVSEIARHVREKS